MAAKNKNLTQSAPKRAASTNTIKRTHNANHAQRVRTTLNQLAIVAHDLMQRIAPTAKERILDQEERQNLSLARDILVSVRKLKLDERRIKASEKYSRDAEEAMDEMPKLTDDLKKIAMKLVAGQNAKETEDKSRKTA